MTTTSLLSTAAGLATVLMLILLAGRLARLTRFARPHRANAGRLHVEDCLTLDSKRRVLLVRCDQHAVLVLTGPQDRVLGWLPEASR